MQVNNYRRDGGNDRVWTSAAAMSPLAAIDEFIYLSLARLLPLSPLCCYENE